MNKRKRRRRDCSWVTLVIFALLFALPIVLTISNSFMSADEIDRSYAAAIGSSTDAYINEQVVLKFIPDMVSLEQYNTFLFNSPEYLKQFWNSLFYAVPITLLQTAASAMAAFWLSQSLSRSRRAITFGYILLALLPLQVTLVPNYLVCKWLGIYDSMWAILLPGIFSSFGVFLLERSMRRIPSCYAEAARLDGAGEWVIFTRIYLPQCKSALVSVGMLIFFDYWNMVEMPLVLLESTDLWPLSVTIYQINQTDTGVAFASAVVYLIPCLLLFLGGEQHLEDGLTTGGVK